MFRHPGHLGRGDKAMIGFVSILALGAGAVVGVRGETLWEAVTWGGAIAVVLALVRFVEFTVQEWQSTLIQLQQGGGVPFVQRSITLFLLHVVWYAFVVEVAAGVAHLLW
jgi:hypothetical protein